MIAINNNRKKDRVINRTNNRWKTYGQQNEKINQQQKEL